MQDLHSVFTALKALLQAYQPPLVARMDDDSHFDLWTDRPVVIAGRKRKEVYFAGLIIQKGYVGFYYMPVYAEAGLAAVFGPELLKLLQGKSCFHVRRLDQDLLEQVRRALQVGFEMYRENGWV